MSKIDIDFGPAHLGQGYRTLSLIQPDTIPTAAEGRILAARLNHVAAGRFQVLLAHSSDLGTVTNFDTGLDAEIETYRVAFRTSKNARAIVVVLATTPAPSTGSTVEPYYWVELIDGLTGTQSIDVATTKRRGPGREANPSPDDLGVVTERIPVDGDTEYRLTLRQKNRAAVVSITVFEAVQSRGLDTETYALVDPSRIVAHGPILADTIAEIQEVAHDLWIAPRMLATWSAEHGTNNSTYAGNTTSGTASNVFTGETSAGSGGAGFHMPITAEDGAIDSGAGDDGVVPIVWTVAGTTSGGLSGVFELRNQSNSVIASVDLAAFNASPTGPTVTWRTASTVIDAGSTTKLEVFHRSPSGNNVRLAATSIYRRHCVDPRDIEGLAVWLDATQLRDAGASYGSNVSTWTDRANGYAFTAPGTAPTFENASTQGAAVRFASGAYLKHTDPGGAAYAAEEVTIIFAGRAVDGTPATRQAIVGYGNGGSAGSRYELGIGASGAHSGGVNNSIGSLSQTTIVHWERDAVHAWTSLTNKVHVSGNQITDQADASAITISSPDGLYIGQEGATSPHPYIGDLFEILVYGRTLSLSETHDVCHYLCVKYGDNTIAAGA